VPACRDKYRLLDKFEVSVPEDQRVALEELGPAWARFLAVCDEAALRLDRAKDGFRERVKSSMENFLQVWAGRTGRTGRAAASRLLFLLLHRYQTVDGTCVSAASAAAPSWAAA
jgi:hypothetical protein